MSSTRRTLLCAAVCLLSFFIFSLCGLTAAAYEKVHIEIPVMCLDVEDLDEHVYRINIDSETSYAPAPLHDTLDINENGVGQFEIDIDEPGTFVYKIYEPVGDELDIDYEKKVYIVTVFVETNENDELLYAMTVNLNGRETKSDEIQFQNLVMDGSDRKKPKTSATTTLTDAETTATTTVTTTTTAAATTTAATTTKGGIVSFVGDVLTGDDFPVKLLCLVILGAFLAMLAALVLKKKNRD